MKVDLLLLHFCLVICRVRQAGDVFMLDDDEDYEIDSRLLNHNQTTKMTRSTKVCIPNSDEQNTSNRLFLQQQFFQIGMTGTEMIEEKTDSEREEEEMLKSEEELRDLASVGLTLDDSS